jgi:hypothetical protein
VRLIRLDDGEQLMGVVTVEPESDEEDGDGSAEGAADAAAEQPGAD